MNNQKLKNFIDLVAFDQNLIAIESAIILSEKKLQKLRDDLDLAQKHVEDKMSTKKELKKTFDLQELHVKDLQDKENHQATVIERAKSTKECDAASKELEHIRAERARQEKKLIQMWNTYQSFEKDMDVLQADLVQKLDQINREVVQEELTLKQFKQDLDAQQGFRKLKIDLLPLDWMLSYENMRGRVINPVVPVSQDSCSACFYSIASRDLQTLRQNGILPCKDCYRFLYFDHDVAA